MPSSNVRVAAATARTASSNTAWLAADGRVVPLTLRTYWMAAASISSEVVGGSKLWSTRMFLHMGPHCQAATVDRQHRGTWQSTRARSGELLRAGLSAWTTRDVTRGHGRGQVAA